MKHIRIIDSHTGGEPTRLVIDGFPSLGDGNMSERLEVLRTKHDHWRKSCMLEPRGHDVLVGALLCEPVTEEAACGVIFFNNTGYLGMCGHGLIGVITSLAYLGRITPGKHLVDTPVGQVEATLHDDGEVSFSNIPSFRYRKDVPLDIPGQGRIHGDIAWGGNWFFLISDHDQRISLDNTEALINYTWLVRQTLEAQNITGKNGDIIDHIELFVDDSSADSRNFVLCPGKQYDRSPCGTGTSAKLACLAADNKLKPNEIWRQASVTGSEFEAYYEQEGDAIRPYIRGRAYLSSDATLIIDESDPFAWGINVS